MTVGVRALACQFCHRKANPEMELPLHDVGELLYCWRCGKASHLAVLLVVDETRVPDLSSRLRAEQRLRRS